MAEHFRLRDEAMPTLTGAVERVWAGLGIRL